jgi:hypothetical protein
LHYAGSAVVNGGSVVSGEEQLDYIPPFFVEAEHSAGQVDHRYRFCYVIFNCSVAHMFNAPRFNSEKDVSLTFFILN